MTDAPGVVPGPTGIGTGGRKAGGAPGADAAGDDVPARATRPFRRSARLADGTRIVIREIRRRDRALVERGFANLSPRSRFLRFLGAKAALSEAELDRLTDPSDDDDVALGALARPATGGRADPAGIVRFVRLAPGSDEAELALTVVDRFQNRGLGTVLLGAIAEKASLCGVSVLFAHVHTENAAMRALAHRFGAERIHRDTDEIVFRIQVASILSSDRAGQKKEGPRRDPRPLPGT